MKFKRLISIFLLAALLMPLAACGEDKPVQKTISAMGASVTVSAYGKSAEAGAAAAQSVVEAISAMLDPSLETSAAYALNNANGQSVVIPGQVADILEAAKTVYDRTGGALDLSIKPLLELWGFDGGRYTKPVGTDIEELRSALCFDEIKLENFAATGTYTAQLPAGARLTFAAAARGCAAQYAIEALRQSGVTSGIISMPGCVQTLGTKPDGSYWNVAIADPENQSQTIGYLGVGEAAISTSSIKTDSFEYSDGILYHHLIDPSTGRPADTDLKSVTVIAENGVDADCLSTALCIIGSKKALKYWRDYGGFSLMMVTNDNRILCTSGLIEAFTLESGDYTLEFVE